MEKKHFSFFPSGTLVNIMMFLKNECISFLLWWRFILCYLYAISMIALENHYHSNIQITNKKISITINDMTVTGCIRTQEKEQFEWKQKKNHTKSKGNTKETAHTKFYWCKKGKFHFKSKDFSCFKFLWGLLIISISIIAREIIFASFSIRLDTTYTHIHSNNRIPYTHV